MKSIREQIEGGMRRALVTVVGPEGAEMDPLVRPTPDPKFGDFQSNVALGLAKRLGKSPREVAESLVAALDLAEVVEPPEIAGPGFINFRVRPSFLAAQLGAVQADPRLGVPKAEHPRRIVADFSGPNLAKEMHIGHLRTTVIGDTIARLLELQGHDVLRLNHVGDWGTQFGMLIQHVRETQPEVLAHPERFHLADLEAFYRAAKQHFDEDPAFAEASRRAVVGLQAGDPATLRIWEVFCRESLEHAHALYRRLGVTIIDRGESFYNPMLPGAVEELMRDGVAVIDQGAVCIFLEGFTNREGQPLPMIIRKSDGGYNYATTDLAAVRHRIREEHAERIIYVTDVRQAPHFAMVFAAARKAGWVSGDVELDHIGYGTILGADRRPYKTRSGNTVKLADVLDEAEARALRIIEEREASEDGEERQPALTPEEKREIARVVGIGAVKYADLSHNPSSDYVFDWDTMLSFEGKAAPYLQYAYTRVRGVARKAGVDFASLPADLPLLIEHETEIALAKQLLEFPGVVKQVAAELLPHVLTDYLYALARAFSAFYDRDRGVRVIDAEPEAVRLSRLRLCDLTARALRLGLGLLGIEVVERM